MGMPTDHSLEHLKTPLGILPLPVVFGIVANRMRGSLSPPGTVILEIVLSPPHPSQFRLGANPVPLVPAMPSTD